MPRELHRGQNWSSNHHVFTQNFSVKQPRYEPFDRSPRHVRLTYAGASFLGHPKALLAANDAALMEDGETPSVMLGISGHALGTSLQEVIRSLKRALPSRTTMLQPSRPEPGSHPGGPSFERRHGARRMHW